MLSQTNFTSSYCIVYRFCCTDRPTNVFKSETNEMLVIFKAKKNVEAKHRRGFKFVYSGKFSNPTYSSLTKRNFVDV